MQAAPSDKPFKPPAKALLSHLLASLTATFALITIPDLLGCGQNNRMLWFK